jgi:hypothetical protein
LEDFLGKIVGAVTVLLVVGVCVFAFFALSGSFSYYYGTAATASAYGSIYAGEGLELDTVSLDWGTLEPDSQANRTIRITNKLGDPTDLSFFVDNWNPKNASDYMALSWDNAPNALVGKAYRDVVFTLTVYGNVTGIEEFSFDVTILGTW